MIKKIKNILKNLTIKQVCKKSAEYFLVFIAIKLFVFAIDSTILRYNRLENGVFRYRDFYTEKQLKNFFDRFYTAGSNVVPLLKDLEKGKCNYHDHKDNTFNHKKPFMVKKKVYCRGFALFPLPHGLNISVKYTKSLEMHNSGYSHPGGYEEYGDKSYKIIEKVFFSSLQIGL